MDSMLESFTLQRTALLSEKAALEAQLLAVKDHLGRLDASEATYRGLSLTLFKSLKPEAVAQLSGIKAHVEQTKTKAKKPTIKQMVLVVLEGYPDGLLALEILKKINTRYDSKYIRTSLSPQLSRLAQAQQIHRRGKRWVLGQSLAQKAVMERKAAMDEPM